MNYRSRFLRLALAVGVTGIISAQIPMSGGVAMAGDDYNLGGGSSSRGLVEAGVIVLFGYGVVSTFTSGGGGGGAPADTSGAGPVDTTGAGGGTPAPATLDAPVWDVSNTSPDLNQFASEAQKAGLQPTLRDTGNYTVFAPTNAAFSALPPGTLTDLEKPENAAQFKTLMGGHIVPGHRYTIADLKTLPGATADPGAALTTLNGSQVYIKYTPGATAADPGVVACSAAPFGPGAEDGTVITQSDIPARNGVIHPVAAILMAPATPPAAPAAAPVAAPAVAAPPAAPPTAK